MSTRGRQTLRIDALAESVFRHVDHAVVCIDVFLSSTTTVTSVALGRRTLIAASAEEARVRARGLSDAILAAEPGLARPRDFDGASGPKALEGRGDVARPLVLVSPAAQLLLNAQGSPAVYVACLRNMSATADVLAERHEKVVLVGAGFGGDVRYEDQMAAAWIAAKLIERGFEAEGPDTVREVQRWGNADISLAALSRGAEHLRKQGHQADLEFALGRVDDLDVTCRYSGGELRGTWPAPLRRIGVAH
jgi:phosphosulfolactate phosphohydrolase-like enzyme